MGAAGQVTDAEGASNPGNVSPLDDPLPDAAGLFVRADGREWLVVVPAEEYLRLPAEDPMRCGETKRRSDST